MPFQIKRVYEPADSKDGVRVLVDRLWPRGLAKADAQIDEWLKDAAPSPALRQWFGHDPAKWVEFSRRYREELDAGPEKLGRLLELGRGGGVTLLYGARDEAHNHAVVLAAYLNSLR